MSITPQEIAETRGMVSEHNLDIRTIEREYGIPIVNKRVSVTPVAQIASACPDEDLVPLAYALDRAAESLGIDYLGGYSALVHKGIGNADRRLISCIPRALAETSRVCSSVNGRGLALYGGCRAWFRRS